MSAVWRFSELGDEHKTAVKCNFCKLMLSRGDRASYNTTNLIQQLKKHKAERREHSTATNSKAGLQQRTLLPGDAAVVGVTNKFGCGHTADIMRQAISHMLQD